MPLSLDNAAFKNIIDLSFLFFGITTAEVSPDVTVLLREMSPFKKAQAYDIAQLSMLSTGTSISLRMTMLYTSAVITTEC